MLTDEELRALFDGAPIGVLLVDPPGTIIEANQPAAEMFLCRRSDLVGSLIDGLVPQGVRTSHKSDMEAFFKKATPRRIGSGRELTAVRSDGSEFPVEIGLGTAVLSGRQVILCFVADISVRQVLIEENRRLIASLEQALKEVRQLSGFLPICASCKRIRDKGGDWHEVEEFIEVHSEAEFSHGICPDCAERLYPQYFPPSK